MDCSEIRRRVRPSFPLDLLARTPEELRDRLQIADPFWQESHRKGRCFMKPATAEWVVKAEGDFRTAERELAVIDFPIHAFPAIVPPPRTSSCR